MAVRPFAVCAACLRKRCGILCRACRVPVPFPPVCKHSPRTCVRGAKKSVTSRRKQLSWRPDKGFLPTNNTFTTHEEKLLITLSGGHAFGRHAGPAYSAARTGTHSTHGMDDLEHVQRRHQRATYPRDSRCHGGKRPGGGRLQIPLHRRPVAGRTRHAQQYHPRPKEVPVGHQGAGRLCSCAWHETRNLFRCRTAHLRRRYRQSGV